MQKKKEENCLFSINLTTKLFIPNDVSVRLNTRSTLFIGSGQVTDDYSSHYVMGSFFSFLTNLKVEASALDRSPCSSVVVWPPSASADLLPGSSWLACACGHSCGPSPRTANCRRLQGSNPPCPQPLGCLNPPGLHPAAPGSWAY